MPSIRIELFIHAPAEVIFDLARSIDIHAKSTAQTRERPIAGRTSGLIELGETVTWEAIHFGIKQQLTAKITEMERPSYFVDEQVRGAFKSFKHTHEFIQAEGGRTRMIDIFEYSSPMGVLGILADKWFLEAYMRDFLLQRNLYIKSEAEKAMKEK
ncbi:SRPBCC family protein [Paenibacillus sp. CGMCC 1.16610]|uniref:Cell division protein n=1 Tax=Paenibacillus anseongense TaxID=2682845 RepID=A0ABW9U1Q0_9BACL|nr:MULTISPECIES: SRPBCC family protein [Paenibacillus]MBA2940839.1 SRPBCC family protein [Paenibacillus sp. CGMCC 1.16610]MVQ34022.1 cell division protein [Paenibacillus anseongense]